MDAGGPAGSSRSLASFPLWIIEHAWSHNMMDILQAVSTSCWPDVDLQSLSLEEPWRLRLASAQVIMAVKRRDVEQFERALCFLEASRRLLPGLVPAIKHMKIVFGLKTLVVMRTLRDGGGTVDTVSKINRFFPSKLPEYQGRCSPREMFLMRKNHTDFKSLAQSLALDDNRRQKYIQKQMEEQYGERYAQKVEERLLQYLRALEAALPGDTHVDQILRKQSPVTEEEKLLLEVLTSDCEAIAATLKELLRCDVTSCCPDRVSQLPEGNEVKLSWPSKTSPNIQSDHFGGDEAVSPEGDSVSREIGLSGEGSATVLKGKKKSVDVRHFCSKHQRWVRNILQECPDGSNASSSPPLLPSSSSTSSSQDLTPSHLVPGPSEPGRSRSGDPAEVCPCSSLPRDDWPSSEVQQVDHVSSSTSRPDPTHPDNQYQNRPSPSGLSSTPIFQALGLEDGDSTPAQQDTCLPEKSCQDEGVPVTDLPRMGRAHSRLSRKFRQTVSCSSQASSKEFPKDPSGFQRSCPPSSVDPSGPGIHQVPTSTPQTNGSEIPEVKLNSGSDNQTESHPHSSSSRDDLLPSPAARLDAVTSSSTFKSIETSPGWDICSPQQATSGSSSPSSHQTSWFEAPLSVQPDTRSDMQRLADSQEAAISTKPETAKLSAEEASGFQTSSPTSRRDLNNSGSPPHPASPSTSQELGLISQTDSCQISSCRDSPLPSQTPLVQPVNISSSSTSQLTQASSNYQSSFGNQQTPSSSSRASGNEGFSTQTVRPPERVDNLLPSPLMPVVQLVDIRSYLNFKSGPASPQNVNHQLPSGSGQTSRGRHSSSKRRKTRSDMKTLPESWDLPLKLCKVSRLSSKFGKSYSNVAKVPNGCANLKKNLSVSGLPVSEASSSQCCGGNEIPPSARSRRGDSRPSRLSLRLSLQSQDMLLHSNMLQPHVSLTRLKAEDCRPTGAPAEEEDPDSSFDLNELFSDTPGSDDDSDLDYKPSIKKKRLLLEYENARMGSNT